MHVYRMMGHQNLTESQVGVKMPPEEGKLTCMILFSMTNCSINDYFLAYLNKSSGRAIVVTLGLVSASESASASRLDFFR